MAEMRDKLVIHYLIAYSYSLMGRTEEAYNYCDYIVNTFSNDKQASVHSAYYQSALLKAVLSEQLDFGNPRAAATEYAAYITKYPTCEELPSAWLRQGMAFERAGSPSEALGCFDQVIALYPNSAEAQTAAIRQNALRHSS